MLCCSADCSESVVVSVGEFEEVVISVGVLLVSRESAPSSGVLSWARVAGPLTMFSMVWQDAGSVEEGYTVSRRVSHNKTQKFYLTDLNF